MREGMLGVSHACGEECSGPRPTPADQRRVANVVCREAGCRLPRVTDWKQLSPPQAPTVFRWVIIYFVFIFISAVLEPEQPSPTGPGNSN